MPEVREVDPFSVAISEFNERHGVDRDTVGTPDSESDGDSRGGLEDSMAKLDEEYGDALAQYPMVRERDVDDDVPVLYNAVIGGSRVESAQANGLDTIRVVIVEWSDAESLAKSITENVESFRTPVSQKNRAEAIGKMMEMEEMTAGDAANHLGVSRDQLRNWTEPLNWSEETAINPKTVNTPSTDPETEKVQENNSGNKVGRSAQNITPEESEKAKEVDIGTLTEIRQLTGVKEGGEREEKLAVEVEKGNLSERDVRMDVKDRVKAGKSPEAAIEEVSEEKAETEKVPNQQRKRIELTYTDPEREALETAAKEMSLTPKQMVKKFVHQGLVDEGYL